MLVKISGRGSGLQGSDTLISLRESLLRRMRVAPRTLTIDIAWKNCTRDLMLIVSIKRMINRFAIADEK